MYDDRMQTELAYLDFELSEDADGVTTYDAMASVAAAKLAAVHAEVEQVLRWAHAAFPQGPGPLDEGHAWDLDLQGQQEFTTHDILAFDPLAGRLRVQAGAVGAPRHTLTLSLTGTPAFCDAFEQAFSWA